MGRFKCRVRRDNGLAGPNKRDTPAKTALSRRDKRRRFLPNKHHEALPEEPEVEEVNVLTATSAVTTGSKPAHCKSALSLSSPAFTEKPIGEAVSPAAPVNKKSGHQVSSAGHPTIQMTPATEAFKVTPESITLSGVESDTAFSSDDDDDEEDCYSSASIASSSLPSPEIFREENYMETLTFPIKEELLGLHLHKKNSTLLDVSHAESIQMHHPPNFSAIIDVSTILADNNCEINQCQGPEAQTKIHMDSFKSDKAIKWKTTPKLINRRPILCKKKVWFKSPMIAETFEAKHIPATRLTIHNTGEPVQTSSPAEGMRPEADTSRAGEITSEQEAIRLLVRLKRPVKSSPEKTKFFDFIDDSDRDAFFQRMRERCVKIRAAPLFPLTAANHIHPSVL